MHYLRKSDCLFLNPIVHKEISDESNIDFNKYIPVSDDFFKICLEKRSYGHRVYIKNNQVLISNFPCPSWYHSLNEDGSWIITEEKQREKRINEINYELLKEKKGLEQIKSDLNYAFIMNREKEINQLKEQAILVEKNIENIINKIDFNK